MRSLQLVVLAAVATVACACSDRSAPVELWFGGDLHVGAAQEDVLATLTPAIDRAVGVVNLEGVLADDGTRSTAERLTNSPRVLEVLRSRGVRLVGVWNNHALDDGALGLERTIERAGHAALAPFGGPAGAAKLSLGGARLAFVQAIASPGEHDRFAQELQTAAADAELLVASLHVVGPPSLLPTKDLQAAVDLALANGADIVVAHGTHAIARVERRQSAVIAWGLGNLAFACDCTDGRDGLLLKVRIDGKKVTRAEIIPIDAGLRGEPARLAQDSALAIEQLEGLGSTPLNRTQLGATF